MSGPTPAGAATVTVAGTGAATAVPDTALLHLGVETRGSTPAEALDTCRLALFQERDGEQKMMGFNILAP